MRILGETVVFHLDPKLSACVEALAIQMQCDRTEVIEEALRLLMGYKTRRDKDSLFWLFRCQGCSEAA